MAQFREIPVPPGARRVRLELTDEQIAALTAIGSKRGIAVSAVCRLAMGLVVDGAFPEDRILAEADRVRGEYLKSVGGADEPEAKRPRGRPKREPAEPPPPKKPRGRPRKSP